MKNGTLRSQKLPNIITTTSCFEGSVELMEKSDSRGIKYSAENILWWTFSATGLHCVQGLMHTLREGIKVSKKDHYSHKKMFFKIHIHMYVCVSFKIVSHFLYCFIICFSHLPVYSIYKYWNLNSYSWFYMVPTKLKWCLVCNCQLNFLISWYLINHHWS